jgi:hypothetical protein
MELTDIPFGITDWLRIEPVEHAGEVGLARWRTRHFGAIRVRLVEYTPGTRRTTGAARGTSCSASPASSRPSWPMAAGFISLRA